LDRKADDPDYATERANGLRKKPKLDVSMIPNVAQTNVLRHLYGKDGKPPHATIVAMWSPDVHILQEFIRLNTMHLSSIRKEALEKNLEGIAIKNVLVLNLYLYLNFIYYFYSS
jgi:hypothetical protein